jgi:hypothetical protein
MWVQRLVLYASMRIEILNLLMQITIDMLNQRGPKFNRDAEILDEVFGKCRNVCDAVVEIPSKRVPELYLVELDIET